MTTPRTWVQGELVTADLMNSEIRDQLTAILAALSSVQPSTLTGYPANPNVSLLGDGSWGYPFVAVARISGYPSDSSKVLRGDGSWTPPVPAGVMHQYGGSSAPTGYLLCDGSSYLRATYPDLFSAIGVAYGAVDGTHFNVPDLRGRVPVGVGSHADVSTLGNNDGASIANRRPKHQHTVYDPGHAHNANLDTRGSGSYAGLQTSLTYNLGWVNASTIQSSATGVKVNPEGAGSSSAPGDAPAYIVVNFIIKT